MEIKKSSKADLQRYKSVFLLFGLIISISICLAAFNWKTSYKVDEEIALAPTAITEQEVIPMTQQQEQQQEIAKPEAPKLINQINIVNREVNLNDDFDPFANEMNENTATEIYEYTGGSEETEVEEEEILYIVEEMPSFQGGTLEKFREFVQKNTRYPEEAAREGIQGKVIMSFVVEPSGEVSRVKVLRGVDPLLDREAIRVIKSSPKWSPGKQRGKPARVAYTIPVVFYLRN